MTVSKWIINNGQKNGVIHHGILEWQKYQRRRPSGYNGWSKIVSRFLYNK